MSIFGADYNISHGQFMYDERIRLYTDTRVRSDKEQVEEGKEREGKEEGGVSEETVKRKSTWDRQRENAKLLDLESPVDARRFVNVVISLCWMQFC